MQQSQEIPEQRLAAASVLRAQAEHVEWAEMLRYCECLEAEYGAIEEYFARQATLLSIPLEIGVAMNMSEGQVRRVLSAAERLRDTTPSVWAAFSDGVIDARRAHLISDAAGRLHRDESIAKLNLEAVGYAAHHTSIELKTWLKKFVARTEADLFNQRAEAERTQRRVDITHGDDAMSWLNAYLPSHVAAAIDKRLTLEARKINDDRTMAQKRADLLASWLTNSAANPFWHSILTGTGGNVLEHRYHGRFAPDILKKALIFTYGSCHATHGRAQRGNAPGRSTAAVRNERLELRGTSSARHQMKSHRVIRWILPSGQQVAA